VERVEQLEEADEEDDRTEADEHEAELGGEQPVEEEADADVDGGDRERTQREEESVVHTRWSRTAIIRAG
jgi:hypothetical protein